jgi:hypothetical protein
MQNDVSIKEVPRILTIGFLSVGWYLFGLGLMTSFQIDDGLIRVDTVRSLLTVAGWFITIGWLSGRFLASSKRVSRFRLYRWMGRMDRAFDSLTATRGRRLCLGVVTGLGVLILLRCAF